MKMRKETFDFYDRTSLKSYNLNKTMQDQLNALSQLDVFTRKHCENVAAITCRICEYLHCKKKFTEYCTICAYLHDLGKLFIPPEILQKPGKLTEEEFEIMKTHTTIGYDMCRKDENLKAYKAGALYHHEALDGSGYPQGLTKKQIPYEAQIIRVADEYDAIVSKRQYKSHIGISDTLKIIIDNTKPGEEIESSSILKEMVHNVKTGKNNPLVVKALIKVVIDDIAYEIYCVEDYLNALKENIERLSTAEKYCRKMAHAKSENKKNYYFEYAKMYFEQGETVDNILEIKQNYIEALENRKKRINKLQDEIKVIKKLRI